jgi:hypothetical protein
MPRIYDSQNNPVDLCAKCFPTEELAVKQYGNLGDDPDNGNGFGYDCSHPCYEWEATNDGFDNGEISPHAYECEKCSKVLRKVDNGVAV